MRLPFADLTARAAFCDPAGGKKMILKRVRARSAIVSVGQDVLGRIFVLAAWADRCATDALAAKIYELNRSTRPQIFGIEANAMQSLFGDMMALDARRLGERIPFHQVPQSTKVDKDWRIRTTLQPIIAAGRLFMLQAHYELRAEIVTFPMAMTKDLIDALASAVALLPAPRAAADTRREASAHLAYLRATGADPSYIEQVAAQGTIGAPLAR